MIEAFPLHWPVGYKRTFSRINSPFKQSMDRAQQFLRLELSRLGATDLIISTNIPVRKDGGLYADYMNKLLPDPGVAIFFTYKRKPITMCCDQYVRVWENIYALGKGIEALRGMERWGVSDFLERAFTGFKALPEETATGAVTWWDILGIKESASKEQITAAFRELSKQHHPDMPNGSGEKFIQIKRAYDQAMSLINH